MVIVCGCLDGFGFVGFGCYWLVLRYSWFSELTAGCGFGVF